MSKWDRIKAEAEKSDLVNDLADDAAKELKNEMDAVDKPIELDILRTTRGAVDLPYELEAQKNNLGPKDTELENENVETNKPKIG